MPKLAATGLQKEALRGVAERAFEAQGDVPEDSSGIQFLPTEVEGIKNYPKVSLDEYEARLTRDPVRVDGKNISALKQTAVDVAYDLQATNPELFPEGVNPYTYMRSSDVPWLRFADEEIKPLKDQDIIANFLRNPDNKPMGSKGFLKTFLTEGLPAGVGAAGGTVLAAKSGFRLGMALTAPVPPATPWTLAVRVGVPVTFAIGGSILGAEAVDALSRKFLFGEDELFLPTRRARAKQKAAETLAFGVGFAPVPRMTATTLNFGTREIFQGLEKQRAELLDSIIQKTRPFTDDAGKPIDAAAAAKIDEIVAAGEIAEKALRDPRSAKFVRGIENIVTRIGQRGREQSMVPFTQTRIPIKGLMAGAEEVAFGTGAAAGRYLSEMGTEQPSGLANLTSEMLFGLFGLGAFSSTVSVPSFITEKAPGFYNFLKRKISKAVRDDEGITSLTEGEKISAVNFIEKQLEGRDENLTQEEIRELGRLLQELGTTKDGKNIAALLEEQQEEGVLTFKQLLSEVGRLSPEFQDRIDQSMLDTINQQGKVILAAYEYGDMDLLRHLLNDISKNIELVNNSRLMQIAGDTIDAFNRSLGRDVDPEELGSVLRERLKQAYDYSRNRAEKLYDEVPEFDVEEFWEPELGPDGQPILRALPNFFDILDARQFPRLPSQLSQTRGNVKPIVDFMIDVLRESGIDTSRLNKIEDGVEVGEGAVTAIERLIQRYESRLDRLMRNMNRDQRILLTGTDDLRSGMRGVPPPYRSSDPEFSSLSFADQQAVLERELQLTDEAISEAQEIREGITGFDRGTPTFNIGDLRYVRDILTRRLDTVIERINLEQARQPVQEAVSNEDRRLANTIINLRLLRDELEQAGFPVIVPFSDLRKTRSLTLGAKRSAEAGNVNNVALALNGEFAKLLQRDIDGTLNSRDIPEFIAGSLGLAQAYYAAFKNTFNGLTGSKLRRKTESGEMFIPDSQLIEKLFSGNRSSELYKTAKDIQDMAIFLPTPNLPSAMLPADREAYRIADDLQTALSKAIVYGRAQALRPGFRSELLQTAQGTPTPASAAEFEQLDSLNLEEYRRLFNDPNFRKVLDLFDPYLENDLRTPISAKALFDTEKNRINQNIEEAKNNLLLKHMLSDLGLGDATADVFVSNVFNSSNPQKHLRDAFKLFDRAVDDFGMDPVEVTTAKTTLFKNIMRYAVRQGTNSQGMIDAEKIKNFVVGRIQGKLGTEDPSNVSLADLLREYDLFNDFEESFLLDTLNKAQIAQNQTIKSYQELPRSQKNQLLELVASVAGSKLAINLNELLGGPAGAESLIIAGRGAALGRALVSAESQVLNIEGLIYMLQNPKELGEYLAKTKIDRGGVEGFWANAKRFLISKGFALPRRTLTGTEETREQLKENLEFFDPRRDVIDEEGQRRGMLNVPLPPKPMPGVTHLIPIESIPQSEQREAVSQVPPAIETQKVEQVTDSTPEPAPDPIMARVAQPPTDLSSPEPRGIPMVSRRDFERMEEQLAGTGRVSAQELGALTIDEQLGAAGLTMDAPLSVRNNNPGNLRMAGQPGAEEGIEGFASFSTPGQGLNALTRQIVLDTQTRGLTLGEFITKYAPPSENDTEGYIRFMEQKTGISRDRRVPDFLIRDIARAIVEFEGGKLALRYFFGDEMRAETIPPPVAQAPTPPPASPPVAARATPQSIQRAARVLGPQDDIGMLAAEMMMRDKPV